MKAFSILSVSIAALLLSACTNEPQSEVTQTQSTHTTDVNVIAYQCEQDLGQIEVRFFPTEDKAELVLEDATHELLAERAASGFWYTNGLYTLRGKGMDLWLEIGRRAPIECQAVTG